jgi:hypothetical protein
MHLSAEVIPHLVPHLTPPVAHFGHHARQQLPRRDASGLKLNPIGDLGGEDPDSRVELGTNWGRNCPSERTASTIVDRVLKRATFAAKNGPPLHANIFSPQNPSHCDQGICGEKMLSVRLVAGPRERAKVARLKTLLTYNADEVRNRRNALRFPTFQRKVRARAM